MAFSNMELEIERMAKFSYKSEELEALEYAFSQKSGEIFGTIKHVANNEKNDLSLEIMCDEAVKTSEIEGEFLNRESIQASIRKNLGLEFSNRKIPPEEFGIAEMMVNLYQNFDKPLTHEMLFEWHSMICNGRRDIKDIACYRTHSDEMQIVSGRLDKPTIHFEAPPSKNMKAEMDVFLDWFNNKSSKMLPLVRAGIAHFHFINIHPFEDGNGRIARAIAQKCISQNSENPALLSLSHIIQQNKKSYYSILEAHNTTCEITDWLFFFGKTILDAQEHTINMIDFLIKKGKFFNKYADELNKRQLKVIRKMFEAGYEGFKGGLSAKNYISISQSNPSTATRDLKHLVEKQILNKTGALKGTRYWLNV